MVRIFTDSRCLGHRVPYGFPEVAARLERVLAHLRSRGMEIVDQGAYADAEAAVAAVHEAGYLERFRHAVERGDGLFGSSDNPLAPGTWDAAWGAVDATLWAADWTVAEPGRRAFAAIRPPGHHAEVDLAMGFCYLGNAAIAAEHLRRRHGLERLAILDFDVHHGNGTQRVFERRADVLYVSVHRSPFYPGTGSAEMRGWGEGRGATLNLPLPAGAGDDVYREALVGRALPKIRSFGPEMLLVSAGFDAWQGDPLGGMLVSRDGYREWGALIGALAGECCEGRVLSVLEGGYDLDALGGLVEAYLEGLEA